MAKRKPLITFSFPVCDSAVQPLPGCEVRYNREDGYSAHFQGAPLGWCDSKLEAEVMASKAYYSSVRKAAA